MNTIYNNRYTCQTYPGMSRRTVFWTRIADGILCAASTMGVITALFFLLTL